jgi:hypothetical protein
VKRKAFILSSLILAIILVGGGYLLNSLLHHEPEFYVATAVPPGDLRQHESRDFEKKAFQLLSEIQYDDQWQETFTEQQVNSWLAEDFVESRLAQGLPSEIRDPRIAFRPGKILLAFRYGNDEWGTVVSVEAKVWVCKKEPNVIAVEVEDLRAGALPLTHKVVMEQITEGARNQNIDVQWYRNEGNPVALLRLQADRREPSIQLQDLEIRQGSIFLKGRSLDPELRSPEIPVTLKPAQP